MASTYEANGRVSAIVTVNNVTYLGGSFTALRPAGTSIGDPLEESRLHLAALDNTTGQLLPWNPGADGQVRALAASPDGTTIYAGGDFNTVGDLARKRVAAVSASTGEVTSFDAPAEGNVYALVATATLVYMGGGFTAVDGQARSRLAAVDTTGALDSTWRPAADNIVRAIRIAADGSAVYVGGDFTSIDGDTSQPRLVRLSSTTGTPRPWASHPPYVVHAIAVTGRKVFTAEDGPGGNVDAYTTRGKHQWHVSTDGGVQAIAAAAGVVYIGGHFDHVGSTVRHKLFAVDAGTAALDPWAPNPGGGVLGVFALDAPGSTLEVGGDFTLIGQSPRSSQQGFAQFD